jgi:hypothetical protein
MPGDQRPAGGGFFSTAPGVLTAVAAVITAAGGVYGVYVGQHRVTAEPTSTVTAIVPDDRTGDTPAPADPADDPVDGAVDDPVDGAVDGPVDGTDPASTDVIGGIALLYDGTSPVEEGESGADPFAVWYDSTDVDGQVAADDCALGYADACVTLEGVLVADCEATWDAACDLLYFAEPAGSQLEDLGATCGYLFSDWTYAGECTT